MRKSLSIQKFTVINLRKDHPPKLLFTQKEAMQAHMDVLGAVFSGSSKESVRVICDTWKTILLNRKKTSPHLMSGKDFELRHEDASRAALMYFAQQNQKDSPSIGHEKWTEFIPAPAPVRSLNSRSPAAFQTDRPSPRTALSQSDDLSFEFISKMDLDDIVGEAFFRWKALTSVDEAAIKKNVKNKPAKTVNIVQPNLDQVAALVNKKYRHDDDLTHEGIEAYIHLLNDKCPPPLKAAPKTRSRTAEAKTASKSSEEGTDEVTESQKKPRASRTRRNVRTKIAVDEQ